MAAAIYVINVPAACVGVVGVRIVCEAECFACAKEEAWGGMHFDLKFCVF